jgi:hypothetical protein
MKLYSLIWDQSFKTTQSKVETHQNYMNCISSYDTPGLLKTIREFIFKSDDRQYKYKAENMALRAYYNLHQMPEMTCQEYFKCVQNVVKVTAELIREARERIVEKKVVYGILVWADRNRYGKI